MQPLAGIHVLLVEDDGDARDIMRTVMEYQGALVIVAPNAKSALVAMETLKPDVLVSDISMPEYDGFWLLAEARRRGWLEGVATLAVTALELKPSQITEAGFDSYLRKPVDPNVLCNTVQSLARGRKERD
jgi:CheY-like chemotaxis protein